MMTLAEAIAWRVRAWTAARLARRSSRRALMRPGVGRVLMVCYGNIYRSAFAGAFLRMHADPAITVRSVGFHPRGGRPSPARHVTMSHARGVDLSTHSSSVIAVEDLAWADLIVLMDRGNWARLRRMGADPMKLAWLGACAAGPVEIADPYAMNDAAAARLLDRLLICCRGLTDELNAGGAAGGGISAGTASDAVR